MDRFDRNRFKPVRLDINLKGFDLEICEQRRASELARLREQQEKPKQVTSSTVTVPANRLTQTPTPVPKAQKTEQTPAPDQVIDDAEWVVFGQGSHHSSNHNTPAVPFDFDL